jgi:hypothetical protein
MAMRLCACNSILPLSVIFIVRTPLNAAPIYRLYVRFRHGTTGAVIASPLNGTRSYLSPETEEKYKKLKDTGVVKILDLGQGGSHDVKFFHQVCLTAARSHDGRRRSARAKLWQGWRIFRG